MVSFSQVWSSLVSFKQVMPRRKRANFLPTGRWPPSLVRDPPKDRAAVIHGVERNPSSICSSVDHTGLKQKAGNELPPRIKHARLEELR